MKFLAGYECPVCKKKLRKLPRHLQQMHNWPKKEAASAIHNLGLGVRRHAKSGRVRRACPLQSCKSEVLKLGQHLIQTHKMDKKSLKYKSILKASKKKDNDEVFSDEDVDEKGFRNIKDYDLKLLTLYFEWVQTPAGGLKDVSTAISYKASLKTILQYIYSETGACKIQDIFDYNLVNVILSKLAEERQARTVQNYIKSMREFLSFTIDVILTGSITNTLPFHPIVKNKPSSENIAVCDTKLRKMCNSFSKAVKIRHRETLMRDEENAITEEDLTNLCESEYYEKCGDAFDVIAEQGFADIDKSMHKDLRTYLCAQLYQGNACRPGGVVNMKIEDYKKMTVIQDRYKISVLQQKTVATHGALELFFDETTKDLLDIYYRYIRPNFSKSQEDKDVFFISSTGKKLDSGKESDCIRKFWRKCGIDKHVTLTSYRKFIVSNVHEVEKQSAEKVAKHMKHNPTTASKYYNYNWKNEHAIEAHKVISRFGKLRPSREDSTSSLNQNLLMKKNKNLFKSKNLYGSKNRV